MARGAAAKKDDKEAVNELSTNEAYKLPQWLRTCFNMWRIVMRTDNSEPSFNSEAFKDWVKNEGWNEIKENKKHRWLKQRVDLLKTNRLTQPVLQYLVEQAGEKDVGDVIEISEEASLVLPVLAEVAVLFLRAGRGSVVKTGTGVSLQVAMLMVDKAQLLECIKEGEKSFDESELPSIVTILLKHEGTTVIEHVDKRSREEVESENSDGEEKQKTPASLAPPPKTPKAPTRMQNPHTNQPMDWDILKNRDLHCSVCKGFGHATAACPPKKGNGYCKRCGGHGHFVKECTSEVN